MGVKRKRCSHCDELLGLVKNFESDGRGGYRAECKLCRKQRQRELASGIRRAHKGELRGIRNFEGAVPDVA